MKEESQAIVQEQPELDPQAEAKGISRRKFLKILGASSAVTATGCADRPTQSVFPMLRGEDEQIPGVAVWYRSTCTECSAGCGIEVRTREGRAVKIEGSTDSPINRGGLCALGQSALQGLYDPDRVRQPLEKVIGESGQAVFRPISWDAAYAKISTSLKSSKKKILITDELSGSLADLVHDWTQSLKADHVTYDVTAPVAAAKASELVYGQYGIPEYHFDRADLVLNFGADFLETWVSPCGYARDWAKARKSEKGLKVIHVEPRLSLTGANADMWLSAKPGTEVLLAKAFLKLMLDSGKGSNLSDDVRTALVKLVSSVNLAEVSQATGIGEEKILLVAHALGSAQSSLVLAGGSGAQSQSALALAVLSAFLNLVLENIGEGRTVDVNLMRKPKTSVAKIQEVVSGLKKLEIDTVFIYRTNPKYSLPSSYEFGDALKVANLVVSFSSHLDETAAMADLILPSNHSLESWGDSMPIPGVYGLIQPVMQPVFDTRGFGDMLLEIALMAGVSLPSAKKTFQEYLKDRWHAVHQLAGSGDNFERFWLNSLDRGGFFKPGGGTEERAKIKVSPDVVKLTYEGAAFDGHGVEGAGLVLMPYLSIKSFDGRAANRPWLQELPDPITKTVWDSWAEINPKTAAQLGIAEGDFITVRNYNGEVTVPAYLTPYVREDVVAVPIGQGHTAYGRFAQSVVGGNVLSLLPNLKLNDADGVALLSTRVTALRGPGRASLVNTQGSDTQGARGLARTTVMAATTAVGHELGQGHGAAAAEVHGHGHGELKQMYNQREHPLYRWGMAVDLAACTGCSACVVACYAENNIPVVGKKVMDQGRELSWLRIERYYDGSAEELSVSFLPMMCQHCGNAPCEPVCPVYAAYHNEEGLNTMIYNRCVGTRYCSNNCSYKVRRFNWFEFDFPEPLNWQLNPDVLKRGVGVMEKCTFCVQRITEAKDIAKDLGRPVADGEVKPACVQSCPTGALTFGNLNDPESAVSKISKDSRGYKVLDEHINTQPAVTYLENIKFTVA